ncbi:MAG: rod shape-determining protein MreD [bacterium]|nr:rod shape-determining protein MreD [bacterium]
MRVTTALVVFSLLSLWAETYLLGLLTWFGPNLFLLSALVFILHWRGPEVHFVALLFGLLADSYSSIPFGLYAMAMLILSFPARWYAIKIFQEALITLPVLAGVFSLACNGLIYLLLYLLVDENRFSLFWLNDLFGRDALPLAALSIPFYLLLLFLEDRLDIRLAERKF